MLSILVLGAMIPSLLQTPNWALVWSDEFNGVEGSAPSTQNWTRDLGGNGWGNDELETYTDGNRNAYLDGKGHLIIEAKKQTITGTDGIKRNYTSARLKTARRFTQKYGRFEARIQIPQGQGIWPAFWLLGDNIDQVGWPECGEIDIMESVGPNPMIAYGTVHGPGYSGADGIQGRYYSPTCLADGYHVYAVEWEPDVIRMYVDDHLYQTVTPFDTHGNRWVFDHPFFIIMNVAVGGYWPGDPNGTTVFPQQMKVDYVRVYAQRRLR